MGSGPCQRRLTAHQGSGLMGTGLYQRRSAARVTFTPASQPYVRRRSRGARRRDLLVLLMALVLLATAAWTATHLRLASPTRAAALVPVSAGAAAGAAKVELPVFAASGPGEAAQSLLAPPYSWDYRWAESN